MKYIRIFEPGSQINTLSMLRKSIIRNPKIKIRFPNRIHMTPIDCNRFGFGMPGGGGIGFAIDIKNNLEIYSSSKIQINTNRRKSIPLILHYFRVMKKILQFRSNLSFKLEISPKLEQHIGLGSSVSIACAVIFGINKMFGDPLSIDEMRMLIANNFVEEYKNKVTRGLETGVGTSVILRGGISVIGGDIVELFHRRIPNEYVILLINPGTRRPESNKPESQDMLDRTFFLDSSYRYIKSYNILMDIIPALDKGDFITAGKFIWDIQYSGTHLSMIQSYEGFGQKIYNILGIMRKVGIEICGLSSVGPAIYGLVIMKRQKKVYQIMKHYFPDLKMSIERPNNNGIIIL